jgi:hypothetical protein
VPLDVVLGPARAAVFAAACVALTAGVHSLVEGHPVGPAALWAGFAAVWLAGLAATRRERSQRAILAAVFAGQAVLHVLFTWLTPAVTAGMTMPGMGPGQAGTTMAAVMPADPTMAAMMPADPTMADSTMAGMTMAGMAPAGPGLLGLGGVGMLSVHLGAGVVVAWWLRRGEAACWRLLRSTERAAAAVRAVLAPLHWLTLGTPAHRRPTSLVPIAGHEPGRALTAALARCLPRRGPPVVALPHRAGSSIA